MLNGMTDGGWESCFPFLTNLTLRPIFYVLFHNFLRCRCKGEEVGLAHEGGCGQDSCTEECSDFERPVCASDRLVIHRGEKHTH